MAGTGSLPVYAPIRLDPTGRNHLLLLDSSADIPPGFEQVECWRTGETFDSRASMIDALRNTLENAPAALRLYLKGSEAFLWPLANIAFAAGMLPEEIQLQKHGPVAQPVTCIACRSLTILASEDPESFACPCGLRLKVRRHFSRRLGAYQGVPC